MSYGIGELITTAAQVNATPMAGIGTHRAYVELTGMINTLHFRLVRWKSDNALEKTIVHSCMVQLPIASHTWDEERHERTTETVGMAIDAMREVLAQAESSCYGEMEE